MKLQQKIQLGDRYNRPDSVVVIASFPDRKNRSIKDIDAVASYADHFTGSFRKRLAKSKQKLIIMAQKIDREEWYEENGMLICRVWDKGSPMSYAEILSALFFFGMVKQILVQFEFHQFGGNSTTAIFPLFLASLRLMRKTVTLVMHQVVTDITSLSGHVNIAPKSHKAYLFNTALSIFYKLSALMAPTLVVHAEILKQRFTKITGRSDIKVIPHGLGAIRGHYTQKRARELLGFRPKEHIVLYFGFLTWYKGADWLVDQWNTQHRNVRLVVAGGASPNLKDDPHYESYVHKIKEACMDNPKITLTGFVEDKIIPLYFAAADMVVLPYRTLMSASGPLAMTIAFQKPFILSKALAPYTRDKDFEVGLRESGLTTGAITFTMTEKDLWCKVNTVLKEKRKYAYLARQLFATRNWPVVASQFAQVIEDKSLTYKIHKPALMHRALHFAYAHN